MVQAQNPNEIAIQHFNSGIAFFQEEAPNEAAGEFLLAIQANEPNLFLDAQRMLAYCSEEDLAISIYKKVVEHDPTDGGSWLWLALFSDSAHATGQLRAHDAMVNKSKYTLQEGLKTRSHGKTAQKGYQKAKEMLRKLDPDVDSHIKIFCSLEAAESAGAVFSKSKDLNKLRESLYYYTFIRDFTSGITSADSVLEKEVRDLQQSGARNVALVQQKIEQVEEEKKRARRIKLIQIVATIAIIVLLCVALYSWIM